ncbi:hypothetical protein GBAR_LOCUS28946 [Geodia barretti]|uniref:Uncharacterized protein n=1 Tax=Geodia barretti TaxID=519541 RepID=A0AA35XIL9_GEOBA|nr:hypothetical protein GBAR_LOCUS28946 [Geodia barretti]
MSSEDESSASFEIVVPLAAGLTVTATIIALVLLVTITFGVVFFIKKSKNKSKRESTTLSSGDITTSPNTVYKAFEKYTSDKATAEVNDDDYEKMDPAETAVTTENNDQQLYEEIDESVIFNSNDSQYDN